MCSIFLRSGFKRVLGFNRLHQLHGRATNSQLQKYLRHCTIFWLKWPVHDLVLVIPSPTLIKSASNTRPCSKLGGTTLNGGEEGGECISTDLWLAVIWSRKGWFFVEVSTFLQLVVARAENHFRFLLTKKERFLFFLSPPQSLLLESFVPFYPIRSHIISACPAWPKGNGNEWDTG